ncbi:MAG: hemerythrin domain-containing protein [Acidimicrobiales bacterium]
MEVHTQIEEQIFYPTIRDASEELAEVVAECVEEHHVAKVLIEEIKGLSPGDEAWEAKCLSSSRAVLGPHRERRCGRPGALTSRL